MSFFYMRNFYITLISCALKSHALRELHPKTLMDLELFIRPICDRLLYKC